MSVIISDLKQLIKKEKAFLVQLILIQAVSIFGILFASGAVINNYMVDRESPHGSLSFILNFGEHKITVSELSDTIDDLFSKKYKNLFNCVNVGFRVPNEEGGMDYVGTFYKIKNGKYGVAFIDERMSKDIAWGRYFTDEDMNSDVPMAVTFNVSSDVFVRNGIEYEIIGKRNQDSNNAKSVIEVGERYIYLQPTAFLDEKVSSVSFGVKRILNSREKKKIISAFEKAIGDKVTMSYRYDDTEDKEAIFKAVFISGVMIVFALLGTLIIMYIYLLSKRRNRLAVWRLVGCNKNKTVLIILLELFIEAEFSLLLGVVSFRLCRFMFLDKAYKYMPVTLTPLNVFAVFAIMSCFILVISAVLAAATRRITVKELLRGDGAK